MKLLLIAGIGVILAGLAAIGFGIPVKEFGFGNTLILTGTVGGCTGLIMVSMALAVNELKNFRPRSEAEEHVPSPRLPRRELNLPPAEPEDAEEDADASARTHLPPGWDKPPGTVAAPEPGVPPWQDEVLRDRERLSAAAAEAPAPEEPKRRNLLFQSSRRERERAEAAAAFEAVMPKPDTPAEQPKDFEDAWPQPDRSRSDAIRRAARTSSAPSDKLPDEALIPDRYVPPARAEEPKPADITVLKSGVVDGMAYSLYSDGSIEAQMPEGMMRFASIDELREHLDNRG